MNVESGMAVAFFGGMIVGTFVTLAVIGFFVGAKGKQEAEYGKD